MRLLPRETSYFDHFETQGRKIVEGCQVFASMIEDRAGLGVGADAVKDIEHQCDEITHRVVEQLHKTFITPLDRNEIHRLITRMDDIMDLVDGAAQRLRIYDMTTPNETLSQLATCALTGATLVLEAVAGMRDLKNPQGILAKCVAINAVENEADTILRGALGRLFREEKNPIEVMKWKEVYELLESATDRCEDVAHVIEGVVLENS